MHADFGSGRYEGAAIGIPFVSVGKRPAAREVRVRDRVGPWSASDSRGRSDRGRSRLGRRPPRDRRRPHPLPAVRAVRSLPRVTAAPLARRLGRDLEPALEPAAPPPAGPPPTPPACRSCPGSPATRRCAAAGSTTRCASRVASRAGLRLPRAPLRLGPNDPNLPAMGQRLRLKAKFDVSASRAVAHRAARAQALRDDPGRQRLPWFVSGAPRPRLGQRRPALAPSRSGTGVRGGGHPPFTPSLSG